MRCEEARLMLFDFVDRTLSQDAQVQLSEHLEHCTECSSDLESLNDLSLQAEVWHDLPAPPWQAPGVRGNFSWGGLQQWFPSLASALALILVAGLYLQQPTQSAGRPVDATRMPMPPAAGTSALPVNGSVDALMTSNRLERQQELQALVQLLTAEMDRRNEETEESLRYVIAHQIQGQREIDDLYQYIRKVSLDNPPGQEQM